MNNPDYQHYFKSVFNMVHPIQPYDDPDYMTYTRLNWFRQQRWLKGVQLNAELLAAINDINQYQKWIFITEPWCGDAAHILPFMLKLTELNPMIELDIQLRDAPPFTIEKYLSGKSKSIPRLVVRNDLNQDLFVWGSRPKACQKLYDKLKIAETKYEQIHVEIQNWYNQDKGVSFQQEIFEALKAAGQNLQLSQNQPA